jgi:hypothetical protein
LTQEAQHAAERLRAGVQLLRTQAKEPKLDEDPGHGVDRSLDALDDAMRMLSSLNQQRTAAHPAGVPAVRRGRIDLAALLVEIAPEARVSIEPGGGTEVHGEEHDLRRLVQVLIGHGRGEGVSVTVRREGDEVKLALALGPDSSPTAETERAWLSRVAVRYGGRYELEGGCEVLVLPAEEAGADLDGEEPRSVSSFPPVMQPPTEARFAVLTRLCAGLAAELSNAKGPEEIVTSLRALEGVRVDERASEVDLASVARAVVRELGPLAERGGVKVDLTALPDEGVHVRRGATAVMALVRELLTHAIEASPRGSIVRVAVHDPHESSGARLVVDDAGAAVPASARRALLALEAHASTFGRPSALPVFLAAELAACQGASLELSDAGATGLRVSVSFAG